MPIPLMIFRGTFDSTTQDDAPSYDVLGSIFASALRQAEAGYTPEKVQGLTWIGPGPRVVRKVHNGAPVVPGGITSAAWVLGYDGAPPSILLQSSMSQWQAFVLDIQERIRQALRARVSVITGTSLDVTSSVLQYNEQQNGFVTFWSSGQAATTHTRDRFPAVNAAGETTADQNENPIGPNDPNLTPNAAPPVVPPGSVDNLLSTLKIVAIGAAVLGSAWAVISVVNAYRMREATVALRDASRGRILPQLPSRDAQPVRMPAPRPATRRPA